MRMLALWEADEAMNGGVSERDPPSAFLALGATRMEDASQGMIQGEEGFAENAM
jgi:hypothetical protein